MLLVLDWGFYVHKGLQGLCVGMWVVCVDVSLVCVK
jgi:hypothetical protein